MRFFGAFIGIFFSFVSVAAAAPLEVDVDLSGNERCRIGKVNPQNPAGRKEGEECERKLEICGIGTDGKPIQGIAISRCDKDAKCVGTNVCGELLKGLPDAAKNIQGSGGPAGSPSAPSTVGSGGNTPSIPGGGGTSPYNSGIGSAFGGGSSQGTGGGSSQSGGFFSGLLGVLANLAGFSGSSGGAPAASAPVPASSVQPQPQPPLVRYVPVSVESSRPSIRFDFTGLPETISFFSAPSTFSDFSEFLVEPPPHNPLVDQLYDLAYGGMPSYAPPAPSYGTGGAEIAIRANFESETVAPSARTQIIEEPVIASVENPPPLQTLIERTTPIKFPPQNQPIHRAAQSASQIIFDLLPAPIDSIAGMVKTLGVPEISIALAQSGADVISNLIGAYNGGTGTPIENAPSYNDVQNGAPVQGFIARVAERASRLWSLIKDVLVFWR